MASAWGPPEKGSCVAGEMSKGDGVAFEGHIGFQGRAAEPWVPKHLHYSSSSSPGRAVRVSRTRRLLIAKSRGVF